MEEHDSVTLRNGKTIQVAAVSPLLLQRIEEAYKKEHPKPIKPTYEAKTAGDGTEIIEHDETTLQTDEERNAWAKWKQDDQVWQSGLNLRFLRAFVLKGVHFEQVNFEEWEEEQAFLGLTVPDSAPERKIHYFETEFISHKSDVQAVTFAIMRKSGMDEEGLSTVDKLFRGEVAKETPDNGSQPGAE